MFYKPLFRKAANLWAITKHPFAGWTARIHSTIRGQKLYTALAQYRRHLLVILVVLLLSTSLAHASEPICNTAETIFCEDWEGTAPLPGQWADGFNASLQTITTTAGNVYQGSRALETFWPAGSAGAGWLSRWFKTNGQPTIPVTGYDHVYARLYFKLHSNFTCAPNCPKVMVLSGNRTDNPWSASGQAGICPNGTDYFYAGVATSQVGPRNFILYDYYPDMRCTQPVGQNYGEYIYFSPVAQAPLATWTCLETEVLLNTPGAHNGLHRAWLNGVLAVEKLNMRWRDSTILNLNSFQLSFSGNPGADTRMWIDNVVVSTQRIGCLSEITSPAAPAGLTVR